MSRQSLCSLLLSASIGITVIGSSAGCSGRHTVRVHAPKRPRVKVRRVRLMRASPKAVVLRLDMTIKNPYRVELPPGRLDYTVWLTGKRLTSGTMRLPTPIPAGAKVPMFTTLRFGPVDAAKVAAKMAIGFRGYRVRARLQMQTPAGVVAIVINKKGKLTAKGVLKSGTRTIRKRIF